MTDDPQHPVPEPAPGAPEEPGPVEPDSTGGPDTWPSMDGGTEEILGGDMTAWPPPGGDLEELGKALRDD